MNVVLLDYILHEWKQNTFHCTHLKKLHKNEDRNNDTMWFIQRKHKRKNFACLELDLGK